MTRKTVFAAIFFILSGVLIFSEPATLLHSHNVRAQILSLPGSGPVQVLVPSSNPSSLLSPFQTQNQQRMPPVANAGPNQMVSPGTIVTLSGSASYDRNPGGIIVYYKWIQLSGVPVILSNSVGRGRDSGAISNAIALDGTTVSASNGNTPS